MTTVMIRQPSYIPYLGFFKKIQASDIFVYLDDVQYSVRGGDNRNKIKTESGIVWLTVPLSHPFGQKLNEVKIANTQNWSAKHKDLIRVSYKKAPFFDKYWYSIESILNKKWDKLIDLNLTLIEFFNSELRLKTKTIKSSVLNITSTSSQRLLEICKCVGADTYISGEMGKNYLDEEIFRKAGINIKYEKFQHPTYKQLYGNFIPYLSIIDVLFNEGDASKEILYNSKNMD
ncbi:MAG: WbqC family protein [Nitrososphaerota archaeon]